MSVNTCTREEKKKRVRSPGTGGIDHTGIKPGCFRRAIPPPNH